MTKKEVKQQVKTQIKVLAKSLTTLKASRKEGKRNGRALDSIVSDILRKKYEVRHLHVAYCLFFNGTDYNDIERKVACDNHPSEYVINKHTAEWEQSIQEEANEEALCVNS